MRSAARVSRPRIIPPKEKVTPATDEELLALEMEPRPLDYDRDCVADGGNAARPCPYAGCKYNLRLDVDPDSGSLKMNFPDLDVDELPETCAIDVAKRGSHTLDEVGTLFNITRERVRQVEAKTIAKMPRKLRRVFRYVDPRELA